MNEDIQNKSVIVSEENYLKEREKLLSLPPEKIRDYILDHPRPAELVQSFPEEDFYFLIHDIGPEDSLALFSMASPAQWEYIIDLESWQRDGMDISALTKWFGLLLQANPGRLVEWLLKDKPELFEYYLFKNIEVIVREHDQDPSDFGKGFFTFDDVYYMRIMDDQVDENSQNQDEKPRGHVLPVLLERLAEFDHIQFQQMLFSARCVIPAEAEEEAYRLRNVRLGEKGFLPFDEAVGVYQYLDRGVLQNQQDKVIAGESEQRNNLPIPLYPSRMIKEESLFSTSLQVIEGFELLQQIQLEFVALCNRIVTADQEKIRDRESLKDVVKKACGYLSIGLGRLHDLKTLPPEQQKQSSAVDLTRFPLLEIFRVGYGSALELKWRAEKWLKNSWFKKAGLPLSFWGESWLGVLGGLLVKRPLFFDNYKTGVLYREFSSNEDIAQTERALDAIVAFDELLSLMTRTIKPVSANTSLNHKNLVLTLWARDYLGLSKDFRPLTRGEFKSLFKALWIDENTPRKIQQPVKTFFINWLAEETGFSTDEIAFRLGDTFEKLFNEIESEYGSVSEADLDPKYIHLFLLSP
ncbi:MAG: DUF6178 family protein [Desulfobacterales bacterium]|nr:DUF6178 family protein [Desulfobacterales bacterium]